MLINICREEEECEDAKQKLNDRSLRTYLSTGDIDGGTKSDSSEVRFHSLGQGIIHNCKFTFTQHIYLTVMSCLRAKVVYFFCPSSIPTAKIMFEITKFRFSF